MAKTCHTAIVIVSCFVGIQLYPTATQASVVGEGSAFGLHVDTGIFQLSNPLINIGVSAQLGPVPAVSGTAPPPFNAANSAVSASVSAGTLLSLGQGAIGVQSGVLNVAAGSNVGDPGGPPWFAEGSASVANFNADAGLVSLVNVLGLLRVADVFSFDATGVVISSEARVDGDIGGFTAFGDSRFLDAQGNSAGTLTFSVLGVAHNVVLDAQGRVAPNTTLSISGVSVSGLFNLDLAGTINIHLNEQIQTGDGITGASMTVNAMRIEFDAVGADFGALLGGLLGSTNLLQGEIIIAQSHATLVPEPGAISLLAAAGMLLVRRRNRVRLMAA